MQLDTSSVTFLLATCAYLGIRGHFKRKLAGATATVSRSSPADRALVGLVVAGQIVLPLLALFTPWLDGARYTPMTPVLAWAGALLMAAGVWLFWRSHADLGDNWSVTLEVRRDHVLVDSGVYRTIRHPMYASFFLMAIGQALLLHDWVAGPAALLAVTVLYVARKPHEEAMLVEQFGDAYRTYMDSTGGIVPRRRARGVAARGN